MEPNPSPRSAKRTYCKRGQPRRRRRARPSVGAEALRDGLRTEAAEGGRDAAVDRVGAARAEAGVVAGEEGDEPADFFGPADAVDRMGRRQHAVEDLAVAVDGAEDGGVDDARADGVDADAEGCEVDGGALDQPE